MLDRAKLQKIRNAVAGKDPDDNNDDWSDDDDADNDVSPTNILDRLTERDRHPNIDEVEIKHGSLKDDEYFTQEEVDELSERVNGAPKFTKPQKDDAKKGIKEYIRQRREGTYKEIIEMYVRIADPPTGTKAMHRGTNVTAAREKFEGKQTHIQSAESISNDMKHALETTLPPLTKEVPGNYARVVGLIMQAKGIVDSIKRRDNPQ